MSTDTPSRKPPSRVSDEADKNQLTMAKAEGDAYQKSLEYMVKDVADAGGKTHAGDYIVGYAQERAEGMYMLGREGKLEWAEVEDENCHLEVSVSDAADGRFIPYLKIHATLTPESGEAVGPTEIPFVWHPGVYHYGKNLKVPGSGRYTLHIRIEPPTFMRHDEVNGQRYADTVAVTFEDVQIETGRE